MNFTATDSLISFKVRLATLDVLSMFSKKIGDVYNSYLSETVPFLAELMEGNIQILPITKINWLSLIFIFHKLDPAEEVEDKVQDLIKELEDILGESLQSHFV